MYQGIFHNTNPADKGDAWKLYLRDDKLGIESFYYKPDAYIKDDEGDFLTLFGDRCSKIEGKYDKNNPNIFEKDVTKELGLLRDLYFNDQSIPSFHNIVYLDIEIEIIGALNAQTIRDAEAEVTSMVLYDATTKKKYCWVLDKSKKFKNINRNSVDVIFCKSEKELLMLYLDKWQEIDPTIVTHWNGDFFDIPYLYYRIKKLLGNLVYKMSPIGKIKEDLYNPMSPITLGLVSSLDFMLLFKKFITKEEPSYKLDEIGTKYVKKGKLEYQGTLNDLFRDDIEAFIDYNVRDVDIIIDLEAKLGFIKLAIQISHLCNTPYESIYYNTVLNEGALLSRLKQKGVVAPNKPTTTNKSIKYLNVGDDVKNQRGTPTIEGVIVEIKGDMLLIQNKGGRYIERESRSVRKDEGYNGGFLLDPKPGLYSWLSDYDYESFYPGCIRSLNLGIETLIGRIVIENQTKELWCSFIELNEMDPEAEIELEKFNNKTYTYTKAKLKVGKLINFIKDNKWNITANGVIYRTDITSLVAEILTDWFMMRKAYKKQMGDAYKAGNKDDVDKFDKLQHSYKILLNAMYGGFAINGFRFTDGYKMISSSITCSCQRQLIETIKYANEVVENEYLN